MAEANYPYLIQSRARSPIYTHLIFEMGWKPTGLAGLAELASMSMNIITCIGTLIACQTLTLAISHVFYTPHFRPFNPAEVSCRPGIRAVVGPPVVGVGRPRAPVTDACSPKQSVMAFRAPP